MTGSADVVVAVDQGSSSTKALAVRVGDGAVVARASVPVGETHPRPGWVEQDAGAIRASVATAVAAVTAEVSERTPGARVAAVGVANQRESVVLWDRRSGEAVAPLVSWQDARGVDAAGRVAAAGLGDRVQELTGLPLDPMFSAAKAAWLLDAVDPDRSRSRRGELCLGTVDSWLVSTPDEHVVEVGNASRTQLLDLSTGTWAPELLEAFGIPEQVLPRVVPSAGVFPGLAGATATVTSVPVTAVLGDSHAALFGHGVRSAGTLKATYGTGTSVMGLVDDAPDALHGMCLTVAWQLAGAAPALALEGNIRTSGAAIAWAARLFGLTPTEVVEIARDAVADGVHLVPGFGGLGAPHWDSRATGLVTGLSLGSGRDAFCRAAFEAVAFQVTDLVRAARAGGTAVDVVLADGGASVEPALMQLQADLAGVVVRRSAAAEVGALGVAHLAGLAAGVWDDAAVAGFAERRTEFTPTLGGEERTRRVDAWHAAVRRALS